MEEVNPLIFWFLLPVLFSFIFFFFIIYRIRRESLVKEKETEQKRQNAEMEMRSLRTQMNPHFIFNCLQSIHQFILTKDNDSAGEYLIKFSKLIRLILENSMHSEIPLKDELEALVLYMDLECLRIDGGFSYEIKIDETIDQDLTLIPPLLLQPFIENSIWHGFPQKKGNRLIKIEVNRIENSLHIIIIDNGVLAGKSITGHTGKTKSLGVSITSERIDLLNKSRNVPLGLKTEDLYDNHTYAGKKVELILPYLTDE